MKGNFTSILIVLAIVAGLYLLLERTFNITEKTTETTIITPTQVDSITVVHKGKTYTLDPIRQTSVIIWLNRLARTSEKPQDPVPENGFERMTIFRYNGKKIVLTAVGTNKKKLVLSAPDVQPEGYLIEEFPDKLIETVKELYMPSKP